MSLSNAQRIRLDRFWLCFKKGLVIFAAGTAMILAGYKWQVWWQIPGLLFLSVGGLLCIYGYLGILHFRLKKAFSLTAKKPQDNDL